MMENPFFGNRWHSPSAPLYSSSVRGNPVRRQTTPSPKVVHIPVRSSSPPKVVSIPVRSSSPPKVVSIPVHSSSSPKVVSKPVHFVESENTRTSSALKIQKVFRAFLVRKSLKRILAIKSEVDEIERRISETVELIRSDQKERLKVNEKLMVLLFKLDSVRGVDSGVRDCRKAVIRKAIMLQETVDAIVSGHQISGVADGTETKIQQSDCGNCTDNSDAVEETIEFSVESENTGNGIVQSLGNAKDSSDRTLVDSIPDSDLGESEAIIANSNGSAAQESQILHDLEISQFDTQEQEGGRDGNKQKQEELLERLIKDNEKLMGLVKELCVTNEMQNRLLSKLVGRVEKLER